MHRIYDIDLAGNSDWVILPECPVCEEDIERAYTEQTLIQEITEEYWEEISDNVSYRVDTWDTYEEIVGVVEPCEHKFRNESKLYYYLLMFRWLDEELKAMVGAGWDPDEAKLPFEEHAEYQKNQLKDYRLW